MSIGISVVLPDGVLLVADGRDRPISGDREPIDDIDKLRPVGESAFAIPFGITEASGYAIKRVQDTFSEDCSPRDVAEQIWDCVAEGWRDFCARCGPDIDQAGPLMAVGIMLGGITEGVPFIVHNIQSPSIGTAWGLETQTLSRLVIGGENQGAQEVFGLAANEVAAGSIWDPEKGPLNAFTRQLISAAVDTIKTVASQSSDFGWPIRYAIVRNGYPVVKDIWRGNNGN